VHNQASQHPSSAKLRSRVLIFSLCPDQSSSYVSMMNGIFSTQKQSIPVDACVLAEQDSLFLQQASHLTKGVYGRVPMQNQHALLQYLMVSDTRRAAACCPFPSRWVARSLSALVSRRQFMYLSDPTSRQHLILPTQPQVDFRATCFCHQQVVSLAVVCPVCLAIFCKSTPACSVCQTRFAGAGTAAPAAARPSTPAIAPAK
jgi:transcription initiation factor TFIIH subunit 3